jgi:UDP-N-acetylglucosamine--N-acetylmuramyl-(pentapeptide) pyrophosphoryl-undecaprenol N-acetylglucosamine transferase
MASSEGSPMLVVVTGGGSSGHVTPALAVVELGRDRGWTVTYVGSTDGIERQLATEAGLPYHGIQVGKLRRYLSLRNFIDPFRVLQGMVEAYRLLGRVQPQVIFSKGGFVGFPVVVAAWLRGVPVVAHESDMSMGLANRLSLPFVKVLCLAHEAARHPGHRTRVEVTGNPIRRAMLAGDRSRGLARFGLREGHKTLLVFGGSLGARSLNDTTRQALARLPTDFQVIHVVGKGNLDPSLEDHERYVQFEYLNEEFPDALACADVVLCRAGANSLAELLALRVPAVLVPLPLSQSRGDQLLNAARHVERGFGLMIADEDLNPDSMLAAVESAYQQRDQMISAMRTAPESKGALRIAEIVEQAAQGAG